MPEQRNDKGNPYETCGLNCPQYVRIQDNEELCFFEDPESPMDVKVGDNCHVPWNYHPPGAKQAALENSRQRSKRGCGLALKFSSEESRNAYFNMIRNVNKIDETSMPLLGPSSSLHKRKKA
jgi:hypothetical protein